MANPHSIAWLPSVPDFLRGTLGELFPRSVQRKWEQAIDEGWTIDRPQSYCPRCGSSMGKGGVTSKGCAHCVGRAIGWDRIVRLSAYTPPMAPWIVSMKFGRQWPWCRWFGEQLALAAAGAIQATEGDRMVVCPVPMYWFRRTCRGFNQAHLIAHAFAKARSWPVAPLFRRIKHSAPQTSVALSQRAQNVRTTFSPCRFDLTGWDVWLIDDVKTSGSTLAPCARLLRRAGARTVYIAVAAVADPKGQDFQAV